MNDNNELSWEEVKSVIESAVQWWVSQLKNENNELNDKNVAEFRKILTEDISVNLTSIDSVKLDCDIYPEGILAKVAYFSRIKGTAFPKQTFMRVSPTEVSVRQNGVRSVVFPLQKKRNSQEGMKDDTRRNFKGDDRS